jgi:hypothetical protein
MSATLSTNLASLEELPGLHVVTYGKTGGLGCFVTDPPQSLPRGTQVVVETLRGLEVGSVLCPASARQMRLLGTSSTGRVVRPLSSADQERLEQHHQLGQDLFNRARLLSQELQLALEILDVEVLFDGHQVVLQFLGSEEVSFAPLVENLEKYASLEVRLENLAAVPSPEEEEDHAGCGKPDCGKSSGGNCSSCSSGGGCSSCGSGKVDMSAYFAHLRTQMEARQRTPLLYPSKPQDEQRESWGSNRFLNIFILSQPLLPP